ncbi:hypothetical protein NC796_14575 [Aliifodinibius sp. S!AR15-10]|uniref:hypothetical protein n=1 Tax=Aliifodinibius sp. S!AR15-10 TaxID=2950437 RepID=UPI00285BCBA4|nr:hypothetical protein [Aliifodinibius sp. S!AR15-10]MDR8392376.1 hypothetical protein [Aliifodinibius sp. S!AR15-10]
MSYNTSTSSDRNASVSSYKERALEILSKRKARVPESSESLQVVIEKVAKVARAIACLLAGENNIWDSLATFLVEVLQSDTRRIFFIEKMNIPIP